MAGHQKLYIAAPKTLEILFQVVKTYYRSPAVGVLFKKIVKEPDARIGHSDMPDVGVLREKAFEGSHNPGRVVGLDKNRVDNAIRKILFDIVYESVTACSIRVSLVS